MLSHFRKNKGFTLLELIISISIITIILMVVVRGQSFYNQGALLQNAADDIALMFSQVQTYSIGVRESTPGVFGSPYGMTFSTRSGNSGSLTSYIYFVDKDNDTIYDNDWTCPIGAGFECLERRPILNKNTLTSTSLCIVFLTGSDQCSLGRIDISFYRPKAEARFRFFDSGGTQLNPVGVQGARITLSSPGATTKSVVIYTTGQVSVQ